MRKSCFGLSSRTRELIKELHRKPTLLEQRVGDSRIIALVQEIRNAGEPAAIVDLIDSALVRNAGIQAAARSAIRHLVAPMPPELLPALDQSLRRSWAFFQPWKALMPKDVRSIQPSTNDDWALVRLLASHPSGYIRAEAIDLMGSDASSDSLPFLLLRSADWVDQVRSAAESRVGERLRSEYADALVNSLSLLRHLESSTRLRGAFSDRIYRLLGGAACGEAVRRGLASGSHEIRRGCFRLASVNPAFSPEEVFEIAVADRDVLVRKWGFTSASEVAREQWLRLRERAATDPFSPVRKIAFESFATDQHVATTEFLRFLLDRSAIIRRASQHLVNSRAPGTAVSFYRTVIGLPSTHDTDICILGLTETGDRGDALAIAKWVSAASARTRRAVIQSLRVLKADENLDLLSMVAREVPTVAREAGISLILLDSMTAHALWQQTLKNSDRRVWLAMLKLFQRTAKWTQIRIYMEAATLNDHKISSYAIEQLQGWVDRYNRSFAQPTSDERKILYEAFERLRGRLTSDLERELRFILQTAF